MGGRCAAVMVAVILMMGGLAACAGPEEVDREVGPFLIVLGIAQDGGVPQAGSYSHPGWRDESYRRRVSCLGIIDPESGLWWMIDATPDFPEQLTLLRDAVPSEEPLHRISRPFPPVWSIFLTHAHIGHYTGLMFLGHESIGAKHVPVYAMPRMRQFLESSGPWNQLVGKQNIVLRDLEAGRLVVLNQRLGITPILVPHRQEYSEVVGFRIQGPNRAALFIPDIDSWEQLDAMGVRIEDLIGGVDVAYLDGTFFANGEIPGRDMTGFPHPFITHSIKRFAALPASERAKVRFIHLNHTNPALLPGGPAQREIKAAGHRVAVELERFGL